MTSTRTRGENICDECGLPMSICNAKALFELAVRRNGREAVIAAILDAQTARQMEAERDEARAQVAMAYEAAARQVHKSQDEGFDAGIAAGVLALTPADAKAALEAYGREKVREGMKMAADLFKDANHGEHIMSAILAEMEKEAEE